MRKPGARARPAFFQPGALELESPLGHTLAATFPVPFGHPLKKIRGIRSVNLNPTIVIEPNEPTEPGWPSRAVKLGLRAWELRGHGVRHKVIGYFLARGSKRNSGGFYHVANLRGGVGSGLLLWLCLSLTFYKHTP